MNQKTKLKNLYFKKLKSELIDLEPMRKDVKIKLILATSSTCLTAIFYIIAMSDNINRITFKFSSSESKTYLAIFLILSIVSFVTFFNSFKKYKKIFKTKINKKVFQLIADKFRYKPNNYVNKKYFIDSNIIDNSIGDYSGDDLFIGKIGEVEVQFSEIKVHADEEKKRILFQGLFLVSTFNKNINYETYAVPRLQKHLLKRNQHIKLESPSFNKLFAVFGEDQIESRYIFTPRVMQAFVKIHNSFNTDIYSTFRGDHVYFAISLSKNQFEPKILEPGTSFTSIMKMQQVIENVFDIINELELNQDIWNKK